MRHRNKKELLAYLLEEEGVGVLKTETILRREKSVAPPLSFAQERLWFLEQLAPDTPTYHIPEILHLRGALNVEALESALNEIIKRHEILRTTFAADGRRPVQVTSPELTLSLSVNDLKEVPEEKRKAQAIFFTNQHLRLPFDLEQGPLIRAMLLRLQQDEHVLVISMHHMVSDGESMDILIREMSTLYECLSKGLPSPLPSLPIQYADFAIWERQRLQGEFLESQLSYWKRQLGGNVPALDLPTDHARPAFQSFKGALKLFSLPSHLLSDIKTLSLREDSTVFMILLSAFAAVLYRCSAQEKFTIGTPVANRRLDETKDLIGFFINSLVLQFDFTGNPTYRESLSRVRRVALDAFDHQDVPFDKLVEALQPRRDLSRAPLRQVIFAMQNFLRKPIKLSNLTISPAQMDVDIGVARLDLTLYAWEEGETLKGALEYSTDLFRAETIERLTGYFQSVIEDMVNDPRREIRQLPPLVEQKAVNAQEAIDEATDSVYQQSNMTETQLLFWFSKKLQPDVQLYFERVQGTFTVKSEIDVAAFRKAFQRLVDDSDSLRSVVCEADGLPRRRVLEQLCFEVEYIDCAALPDPALEARKWIEASGRTEFDFEQRLFNCALLRIAQGHFICYLDVHHIIADVWSASVIARTLSDYYSLALRGWLGGGPPLPAYQDFVDDERQYRLKTSYGRAENYWREKLSGSYGTTQFYRTDTYKQTTRAERLTYDLGFERSQKLKEIAGREGFFSPAIILAGVLFVYLHRISGEKTLRVGSPFANRKESFKNTIGLFMTVCPLQLQVDENDSLLSVARKFQAESIYTARHQHYPIRNHIDNKVYDVYFNYQNASFTHFCEALSEFELINSGHSNDTLTLQARDFNSSGHFMLDFDFKCDAFNEDQRLQTVQHYLRLLDAFLERREESIHSAGLLSAREQYQLLADFNDTETDYPAGMTLHSLIELQVDRTPGATALIFEDQHLTYLELNRRSNRLAHCLQGLGVGRDTPVAICVERSVEMVVGILGILKAGGAYVPLDPTYPVERLKYMVGNAQPPVLLTQRRLLERCAELAENRVCLDTDWGDISAYADENPVNEISEENLAYVIYTSGSTGKPKGVMISHRGICNRLFWMQDAYNLTPADRVLQKTSFSFDVSVWEFFWPLIIGASLVVARPGGHQDGNYLAEVIARQEVTTVHFVPSMLHIFIEAEGIGECHHLKRVICSGEALPYNLQRRFFEKLNASLHNLYGPTEASVDVTAWDCQKEGDSTIVPIGRAIANTQMYVLDRWLNLLPLGISGQLCIGGAGLARGYLNRPELTAEKFIPNPFSKQPGMRLYVTGDLARLLPDGNIEFLGRLDNQVKIRGFRIELGEIESSLAQCEGVREVAVLATESRTGDKQLIAYIVPEAGASVDPDDLRRHLKEELPEYMVPSAFVMLEELPLTSNGKLDRAKMPTPDFASKKGGEEFVAPRSDLERILAEAWASTLGIEQIGVHSNFFELGGHSLLATQLVSKLQKLLPVQVQLRVIFEAPTIAAFAERISSQFNQHEYGEQQTLMSMVAELERLSDTEVDDLLSNR